MQARFEPASVTLSGEGRSALTVTLPPGAALPPTAVEVKGTDAAGKVNTLCLQLGPATGGELSVVSALAPPTKTRKNLEIILDASGSMKTPLAGKKTRWDVALGTLQQVLANLPDDFNVGLRIYGHRETSRSPKTCTDSELIVPIEKLNRQNLLNRAKAFRPKGETPLVYSALQAPADLKAVGGGTVILITDGEESCKGDTVKAAADLKASGLDIRLNIVGFALKDPRVQKDLAGFSQATGGLFYSADTGGALADAVMVAAVEKFPYTVYDAAGKAVLAGEAGIGADQLPAGDYKVVVKAGTKELVAPRVSVGLGQSVTLTIAMKNGQLVLQ
jgi:Ca-activated chloride channel family protein